MENQVTTKEIQDAADLFHEHFYLEMVKRQNDGKLIVILKNHTTGGATAFEGSYPIEYTPKETREEFTDNIMCGAMYDALNV